MTIALALLAAVCAVNAIRARAALPDEGQVMVAALGAAMSLGALALVAALADPVIDGLHLTVPTVRMAAGVVLVVQGAAVAILRPPAVEPRLGGPWAALVPVAFPVLLTPGLGLLALSISLDRSAPTAVVVLAAALATVPVAAGIAPSGPGSARPRVLRALGAVLGGVLLLTGMALVADGLFDL